MDNNNNDKPGDNNNDDKPGDNNNDDKPGNNNNDDKPGNNNPGENPVPPAPVTAAPVISIPVTVAPVSSAPVTLAPVKETPSPSVPTSIAPTKETAPAKDPTASPTKSAATSPAVTVVDLLAFVVVQDGGTADDVTSALEGLLATQLGKEFDSLTAIQLDLQTQKVSRRALLEELVYSGTATFDSQVSAQDVQQAQTQVLEDSTTVQEVAPTVSSITVSDQIGILAPSPAPAASTGGSSGASAALIAGIVAAVALALAAVLFLGYRYYKSPPPPPPPLNRKDENGHARSSTKARKARNSTQERPKEKPSSDTATQSGKSYGHNPEIDDYSLDAFSMADSEVGLDKTQLYLAQRYKEKQRQQQNLANDDQSCDASDADFSYDLVGKKGVESDDEVYTSEVEPSSIEVGIDGNAAYMTGYFGHLGGPHNNSRKGLATPPRVQQPTNNVPSSTRPRNDIPFDEPDERPFDETTPVKSTPPTANTSRNASASEQAKTNDNDSEAEDYPIGRTRSNNSRQSLEDETEDLSSFLRGRRKAKRAARKNRETRKQPPIAMEV